MGASDLFEGFIGSPAFRPGILLVGAGTDALVAVQVGSATDSTFYAVSDKLGSVRAWVLRKDGSWRWGMRYRPYGVGLDSTGTAVDAPYRWVGREYDPETGFYFMRARYYDPGVGRFTQEDPLGTAGGTNLYAYVDGQPLEARDPSGMLRDRNLDDPCPASCGSHGGWDGWFGMYNILPTKFTDLFLDGVRVARTPGWISGQVVSGSITLVNATDAEATRFWATAAMSPSFLRMIADIFTRGVPVSVSFKDKSPSYYHVNQDFGWTGVYELDDSGKEREIVAAPGQILRVASSSISSVHVFISRPDLANAALAASPNFRFRETSLQGVAAHEMGHAWQAVMWGIIGDEGFGESFEHQVMDEVRRNGSFIF